jgi:hypothetical protein
VSDSYSSQQQQQRSRGPGARKAITNCTNNAGLVQVTATAHGFTAAQKIDVTGVIGTTEANGVGWAIVVVDANNFTLTGSAFVHAYVSGGLAHAQ